MKDSDVEKVTEIIQVGEKLVVTVDVSNKPPNTAKRLLQETAELCKREFPGMSVIVVPQTITFQTFTKLEPDQTLVISVDIKNKDGAAIQEFENSITDFAKKAFPDTRFVVNFVGELTIETDISPVTL